MSISNQKEVETEMDKGKRWLFTGVPKLSSLAARVAKIKVRFGWLIILAALLHIMPFALSDPSSLVELKRALLALSYVLLFVALSHNLHLWSMRLLILGAVLNFAAIMTNGGLMPMSPEAGLQAGMTDIDQSGLGKPLPGGASVLLPVGQTNLWFLSDIIPISLVHGVFSPGDVLIGVGLFVFFVEASRLDSTRLQKKELATSFVADTCLSHKAEREGITK